MITRFVGDDFAHEAEAAIISCHATPKRAADMDDVCHGFGAAISPAHFIAAKWPFPPASIFLIAKLLSHHDNIIILFTPELSYNHFEH